MALGLLKKVFSFGKKEVEERPVEDEPLAPLNFEALKQFAADVAPTPPSPLRGGSVDEVDRGGVGGEGRDLDQEQPAVQQRALDTSPTPSGPLGHLPLKGGEDAAPSAPETVPAEPTSPEVVPATPGQPEIPAEPEPQPAAPEVPAEPVPEPEKPEPAQPEISPPPVEVPPPSQPKQPPARPIEVPAPAEPKPAPEIPPAPKPEQPQPLPPMVPEPAPEAPPAPPVEVPAPAAPVEVPARPSPLRGGWPEGPGGVGAAVHDVGQSTSASHEETLAASPTPSGPSGHLPLKEGEDGAAVASNASSVAPSFGKVTVAKKVEQKAELAPVAPAPEPRKTWFQRLREGLSRSSRELSGSIAGIFTKRKLDDDTLEELEDVLIRADLGMETALRVTDTLASSRYGKDVSDAEVRTIMAQEVEKVLTPVARALELDLSHKPHVILVVGVNGTGKTTTIGKLAAKLQQGGLSVMLAAGDTFRAAAIEQLKIWGERTGSPVVSSKLGADAAGLAWDAFEKAREAGSDVLIIDTAGRLQNKAELMAELEKIVRVLGKHDPEAPHTVLQTVDATTGQNALNQVEIFRNVAGVNGLVMTKLDGTARGGILVAIAAKHKLPVYFIGVGEQVDDLEPFSASDFAKAIAGVG
jgi:fused signal recognition particle receptor